MQFSKFMPLVCAAAFCASLVSVRADDTNAVPTAETIQRSMMPLPGENKPASSAPTSASADTRAALAQIIADNKTQAKALQALQQKMSELDGQQASTTGTPPVVVNPSGTAAAQPAVAQPAETAPPTIAVTSSGATQEQTGVITADSDEQAKALQALQEKMAQLDKEHPETTVTESLPVPSVLINWPDKSDGATAGANYPGKKLGLNPIEAPPAPVSADKEAQLQALLARYKADQVSPDEYQKQRAAILAQP